MYSTLMLSGGTHPLGLLVYGDFCRTDFRLTLLLGAGPWKDVIAQSGSFSSSDSSPEERLVFLLGDLTAVVEPWLRVGALSPIMEDALVVVVELVHDIVLVLRADAASCDVGARPGYRPRPSSVDQVVSTVVPKPGRAVEVSHGMRSAPSSAAVAASVSCSGPTSIVGVSASTTSKYCAIVGASSNTLVVGTVGSAAAALVGVTSTPPGAGWMSTMSPSGRSCPHNASAASNMLVVPVGDTGDSVGSLILFDR
jgi:hypothetical protein